MPGVSFSNQDPWGSLGGSFTVRGFSSDRVSQTIDGIPLNDSGNYALYTNQQLDPEIIEAATVSLGSTDVDSPTASAAGGTINIPSTVSFGTTTVGGTSMACVLRHVIETRPRAAVVVTDGFIEGLDPSLVAAARSATRLHAIIARHGSPAALRAGTIRS